MSRWEPDGCECSLLSGDGLARRVRPLLAADDEVGDVTLA